MLPGLRLRQERERLGMTYREVHHASRQIAQRHGRPDFILHISRLADIENRQVVPSLHKLYSLAAIYHLSADEIAGWYEAPLRRTPQDGASFPPTNTHLSESASPDPLSPTGNNAGSLQRTGILEQLPAALGGWPGLQPPTMRYRYGHVGLNDHRMAPILPPGSIVLVDTEACQVEDGNWRNEYERPIYFVELHDGYRCGWFYRTKNRLLMQPHVLSRCMPESWRTPDEAEVVGRVVGVVTYLSAAWPRPGSAIPEAPPDSNRRVV